MKNLELFPFLWYIIHWNTRSAMNINAAGKAAVILGFFSLLSACGEMEMLLPSTGSYQVKALVNNNSLESCSILRSDDKIRPYFTVSTVKDRDLIGLLVYFENSQGEVTGGKIRYILQSHVNEVKPAETETEIEEQAKTDKTDEEDIEETIEEITQETEEIKEAEELPEQKTVKETPPVAEVKPVVKNINVDIVVKSLSGELPYLPLPKTLGIGSYTLVFEAIGVKETLSRTETNVIYLDNAEFHLKDISMYLPSLSGSQLIAPGTTVMLDTRLDFDRRLDPYVIWYNGKNIIREGKISGGAGTILWKAPEQAGFYSLRMEAFPFQFKRTNYIGISREITLPVSPKAVNQGYFFENNREYTARSPLAARTAYPEQALPIEDTDKVKEKTAPALPPPSELLRWYKFEGSLRNSISPSTDAHLLTPVNTKTPRWAAAGQSYGLSTGLNDAYTLSPISFFRKGDNQGGGVFLFHIIPATEGAVFDAFFPSQSSSSDGVRMNIVREGNSITLYLSAESAIVEIPVYFTSSESQGFIPIAVEFYIRPYRLEAKLSLSEDYSPESKVGSIKLPGALSGEGRIRLGGGIDKSILTVKTNNAEKNAGSAAASETPSQTVIQNTIWDEFAVLFSTVPLLEEDYQTRFSAEAKTTEQKSERYVPAVQYEAEAAAKEKVLMPVPDTDKTENNSVTSN